MSRNLEDIFGSLETAVQQKTYKLTAVGGETRLTIPYPFRSVALHLGGALQTPGVDGTDGAYYVDGQDLILAGALNEGTEVQAFVDALWSPNPDIGQWSNITWSGENAAYLQVQDVTTRMLLPKPYLTNNLRTDVERITQALVFIDNKVALNGVNNDITNLTALSGALRLGGDAIGAYDAVTLRQLQAAGGGGGANMTGVMNNHIGAVEWFNGTRAKLPSGCIPADGQLVNRTDATVSDLWAAVSSGMYVSTSTDALWLNNGTAYNSVGDRGKYSPGNGTTTFRVPDLNGMQSGSSPALFLRGGNTDTAKYGTSGSVLPNRAPNIVGTLVNRATVNSAGTLVSYNMSATGSFAMTQPTSTASIAAKLDPSIAPTNVEQISLDASRSWPAYGRVYADGTTPTNEVAPNAATGIWIIRASGAFVAANTAFSVITGDAVAPANGVVATGGALISNYQVAGGDVSVGKMYSQLTLGDSVGYTAIEAIKNGLGAGSAKFLFGSNGTFNTSGEIKSSYSNCYRMTQGNYGSFWRQDGSNLYLMLTNSGDADGPFNALRPFRVVLATGLVTIGNGLSVAGDVYTNSKLRTGSPPTSWSYWTDGTVGALACDGSTDDGGAAYQLLSHRSIRADGYPQKFVLGQYMPPNGTNGRGYGVLQFGSDTGSTSTYARYQFADTGQLYGTKSVSGTQSGFTYTMTATSDSRLKHDITYVSGQQSLDNIDAMSPATFIFNTDDQGRVRRGFIAQDLEQIDPEYVKDLISTPDDGGEDIITKVLDTNVLLLDALAAIKVLSQQNKDMQAEIDLLKAK